LACLAPPRHVGLVYEPPRCHSRVYRSFLTRRPRTRPRTSAFLRADSPPRWRTPATAVGQNRTFVPTFH
jgi:hypothetical protein